MGFVKNFFKESIIFTILQALPNLAGFIMLRFNSIYLSKAEFHTLNQLTLLSNLLIITCTASIDNWYFRKYYELDDNKDNKLDFAFTSFVLLFTILIAHAIIVVPISNYVFNTFLHLDIKNVLSQISIILVIILSSAFSRLLVVIYRIEKKKKELFILSILQFIFQITISYSLLIQIDDKIWASQIGKGLGMFAPILFSLLFIFKNHKVNLNFSYYKASIPFIWPLIIGGILTWGLNQSDQFILDKTFSDKSLKADYSMAFSISIIFEIVLIGINSFIIPDIYAKLSGKSEHIKINNHLHLYTIINLGLMFVMMFCSYILVEYFISHQYQNAIWMVGFLLASTVFKSLGNIELIPVYYHKKTLAAISTQIIALLLFLGINLILIPYYGVFALFIAAILSKLVYFIGLYLLNKRHKIALEYNHFKTIGLSVVTFFIFCALSYGIYAHLYNFYLLWLLSLTLFSIVLALVFKDQIQEVIDNLKKTKV